MQRLAGGKSLPEIRLQDCAGGGGRQDLLPAFQQQPEMPTGSAMETKTAAMNALTAKYPDNAAGSSTRDFPQSISDVDRQRLLKREQLKAELIQRRKQSLLTFAKSLETKLLRKKMQHDNSMAVEMRRSEGLEKLLKNAMEEKENWEKAARQLSIMVEAMKHALSQGQQNCITCFSSSGTGDAIAGEEVASKFRRNSRDEDGEGEPAAKRRKRGGWS